MRINRMEKSIKIMVDHIVDILADNDPSIYLYGSLVLDDFKLGWSDIDILCLTEKPINDKQAHLLVNLRQNLSGEYSGNCYFRLFEGGMLSQDALLFESHDTIVYWGTSGQKITDSFALDPFAIIELLKYGRLLYGLDHRALLHYPSNGDIIAATEHHYNAIRNYAKEVPGKLTSCGWLLDIARCLYTLDTWDIIAKTKAGEWALQKDIAPDKEILRRAVEIRKNPMLFKTNVETLLWLSQLGPYIQRFADVLEQKLVKYSLLGGVIG